jgi:mannitol-1-/sugar-/sorbitol-6-/2-deoxyglucose-6-phosphatase
MKTAVIFDMDGLLVNTEPLWWQAGAETLRTVGVDLDDNRSVETMGLRTDAALEHWFRLFPWKGKSLLQVEQEITSRVLLLVGEHAKALPGVYEVIELFAERAIPMGVCSSSPYAVIKVVLKALGLESAIRVAYSAENEPFGKPHPAPYLSCAKQMGVAPRNCIAFEDSLNGAIAAKRAEMTVVAVPSCADSTATTFDFCDLQLRSLSEFSESLLAQLLIASDARECGDCEWRVGDVHEK